MDGKLDNLIDRFRSAAADDLIGLCQVMDEVENETGIDDPTELKRMTLQAVKMMLMQGFVACNPPFGGNASLRWKGEDVAAVIERISSEWDALGRPPNIPDIVWFDYPDTSVSDLRGARMRE